ncbi:MAG: BamA/TamA family outer membrane protein [Geitlerinemataceae cyanobacterium]
MQRSRGNRKPAAGLPRWMSECGVQFVARFGSQQLWCVEESANVNKLELYCLWVATIAASATFVLPGEAAVKMAPKPNPNNVKTAVTKNKTPIEKQQSSVRSEVQTQNLQVAEDSSQSFAESLETESLETESLETALPTIADKTQSEVTQPPDPTVADPALVVADPAPTAVGKTSGLTEQPQLDEQLDRPIEGNKTPQPDILAIPSAIVSEDLAQSSPTSGPEVLVAEVEIRGATSAELEDIAYAAIGTQPGRTTTRDRLIEDANAIYATGYFANVEPVAEDTPLGVRVVFVVTPNPVLNQVSVTGNQVLPSEKIDEFFGNQYGRILNFRDFQEGIERLNQWYQDNGYVLAQVIDPSPDSVPAVDANGTAILDVAEGQIEAFDIRFRNEDGDIEDADGNPIDGRTKEYVITREMRLQEGDVFNRTVLLDDLGRIVRLGLFEDAEFTIEPGTDPRKVVVVLNAVEGSFGSFNFGGGFSSATGLFGSVGAEFLNIGGRNQRLGGEAQVGTRGLFFDLRFTDPWLAGDPYRTSFSANVFNRRSISLVFDGSEEGDRREIELDNGDRPRVQRLGGRVNFSRPLSFVCPYPEAEAERCDSIDRPALERPDWVASLGLEFENVSIRDGDGDIEAEDEEGNLLSFNDDGSDNLLNLQFGLSRDRRNNTLQATDGSYLRFSTDQSIPIDGIFFNRVRAGYSYYIPVKFTDFADGPQALAFNIEAGTILGDLPPYEAFAIGGTNSVRGFEEGDVGVGRSFAQATVEYRFPVFSVIGGALFLDAATTFGTQGNVPGDPGGVRGKPGDGVGYGVGVRIQSPIGPIRIDYGLNNEGDNRFHFGIGERF